MKLKSIKKYTTKFKSMAFSDEPETEILTLHSIFDENGHLTGEEKIDQDEGDLEINRYRYNSTGKLIQHELILESEGISELYEFLRDEKDRIVKEVKYYGEDPGERTEYTYEAHEQPITIARYDADGEPETFDTIIYNEKDLVQEHHRLGPDKKLIEKAEIIYGEKDQPVEKKVYDDKNKLIRITTFSYNEKGDVTRIIDKNPDGVITSDVVSIYDERGNVIERKIRDFHSRTFRFAFDENDNCTQEETFDENGNLTMKSNYEFDENNRMINESGYFLDLNRSSQMANTHSRYEYEYF